MSEQDHGKTGGQDQPDAPPSLPQDPAVDEAVKDGSESEDEDWSDDSVPFVDDRANGVPTGKSAKATDPGKTRRSKSFSAYSFRQHRRDDQLGGRPGPLPAPELTPAGPARGSKSEGAKSRLSRSDRPPSRSTPSTSGSYYPSYHNPAPISYMNPASTPTMVALPPFGPAMPGIVPPPFQQYYGPPSQAPPPYPRYPNVNAELPSRLVPDSRRRSHRQETSETLRRDGERRQHGHRRRMPHRDSAPFGDPASRADSSERKFDSARAYLQKSGYPQDRERERDNDRNSGQNPRYDRETDMVTELHEHDKSTHPPRPDNVVIIRGSYDIERPQHLHKRASCQDIGTEIMLQQVLRRLERLEMTVASSHQTSGGYQNPDRENGGDYHVDNGQPSIPEEQNAANLPHPQRVPPDQIDHREGAGYHSFHNAELDNIEIQANMNTAKRRSYRQNSRRGNEVRSRSPPTASMVTQSNIKRKSPKPRPPSHSSSRKTAYFEEVSDEDDARHYTFKLPPQRTSKDSSRATEKPPREEYDSADEPVSRRVPRKVSPTRVRPRGSTVGHSKKAKVEQRIHPPVPPAVPDAPPS